MRPTDLRDPGLVVVTHGSRAVEEPTTPTARAQAFLVAMRGPVALSHISAAQVWEIPLPRRLEAQCDLDVMCGPKAGPVKRDGCIGHRGLTHRSVVLHRGVEVTSLADTWVDLGEVLKRGLDLDDLVVAGDVIAKKLDRELGEEGAGAIVMRSALMSRVRPRGKKVLIEALGLISPRSKSPMETRARLMFHRGGLPAPELNVAVDFASGEPGALGEGDGPAGWMLEGDFVWREQRVIGEYQGEHHKDIRQRAVDVARRHLAEDDGWTFVEIFAGDVYTRPKRISMLRRLGRELGVRHGDLNLR